VPAHCERCKDPVTVALRHSAFVGYVWFCESCARSRCVDCRTLPAQLGLFCEPCSDARILEGLANKE